MARSVATWGPGRGWGGGTGGFGKNQTWKQRIPRASLAQRGRRVRAGGAGVKRKREQVAQGPRMGEALRAHWACGSAPGTSASW